MNFAASKTFALRCNSCGALLSTDAIPVTCSYCGAENWEKDKFSFAKEKAVAHLRAIHSAQNTFQCISASGNYGTATELFMLGLIQSKLAEALGVPEMQNNLGAVCRGSSTPISGYRFEMKIFARTESTPAKFYAVAMIDDKTYQQGIKLNFYIDEHGIIKFASGVGNAPTVSSPAADLTENSF